MSPVSEAKEMARQLSEFGEHVKKISSEMRSHHALSEEREAALRTMHEEHKALEKRLADVDETTWEQIGHTINEDLEGMRSRFDTSVAHVDERFRG